MDNLEINSAAFNSSKDLNLAEVKLYIQVHYMTVKLEASYGLNKK